MKAIKFMTLIAVIVSSLTAYSAKLTKIKLTGTLNEPIAVTVGQTGRTEIINSFPFIIEVVKEELPLTLKFKSDNYLYYDIDVPKKPFDTTGHVYLVKINELAMDRQSKASDNFIQGSSQSSSNTQSAVSMPEIDYSFGVNVAPITGLKNEKALALIIGNEQYESAAKVDNAISDALAFKEYCLKTFGIPKDNIRYMSNLTFGRMRKTINDMLDLANMLNGEATLIIYYAGHGIPDNKTKDAFLMPVDADGTDTEVCISLNNLYAKINQTNLDRCIVFLDACFSGAQRGGDMIVAARGVRLKPKASVPDGKSIVFSATSNDEAAFSHRDEKHGLFTYHLLKKLQETKGNVKLGELAKYLTEKVGFDSRRINNSPQTPTVLVAPAMEEKWQNLYLAK